MASRSMVPDDDPHWRRFWEVYPRRDAKLDARKAWAQLSPDEATVDAIIHALGWQRQTDQWRRGFVPLPASYLRGRRWEDEPRTPPAEPALDRRPAWLRT